MSENLETYPIDVVLYWVDGNDIEWQKKKNSYIQGETSESIGTKRFRDWNTLHFILRGIEKYMPWVNKIFFISDSQIPCFMNISCDKLRIVDHKDYIPEEFLPTFSANPIELNFHRIPDLSEHFIVFNDDIYVTGPLKRTDFFKNGLPVDILMEYPIMCGGNVPVFSHLLCNDYNMIGKYFQRKEYKKRLRSKFLTLKYGKFFFYNLMVYVMPFPRFFGLINTHLAMPHLKSTYEELWKKEEEALNIVCHNHFRNPGDVNMYIFRIWNLLSGKFVPGNVFKMGKMYPVSEDSPEIYKALSDGKYKLVCINDECDDTTFDIVSKKVTMELEKMFPDKSIFEL